MWEEIFKWLDDHYHGFAILSMGMGIAFFFTKEYYRWTWRLKRVEDKIDSHVIPQLSSINASLNYLGGLFNNLVVYLKTKDEKMDVGFYLHRSPIQLTDLAERILIESGGRDFIDNNISILVNELNGENIKTAFDVQIFAPIVIFKLSNQDSFIDIKNYAYNNPCYKEKNSSGEEISHRLSLDTITDIMGIYLRNIYLDSHPELATQPSGSPQDSP
jgi:hypothetical protein